MRSAVRIKESHDSLRSAKERLQAEIARRKAAWSSVAQSQKLEAIGHLAAGIVHEINTPSQYVGDNTRFLRDVFADVNTVLDDLDKLLAAAKCGEITESLIEEVNETSAARTSCTSAKKLPRPSSRPCKGSNASLTSSER